MPGAFALVQADGGSAQRFFLYAGAFAPLVGLLEGFCPDDNASRRPASLYDLSTDGNGGPNWRCFADHGLRNQLPHLAWSLPGVR